MTRPHRAPTVLLIVISSSPCLGQGLVSSATSTAASAPSELLAELHLKRASLQDISVPDDAGKHDVLFVRATLDGVEKVFRLHPHSLRAPGFRVLVQTESGVVESVPEPPSTWRGHVIGEPTSAIAASVEAGQIRALVRDDQGVIWSIQPQQEAMAGRRFSSNHVVYRAADIRSGGWSCATEDLLVPLQPHAATSAKNAGPESPALQIAFDADFEYFQQNGSSVVATVADIEAVMNAVGTIFLNQINVDHVITTILVRTIVDDPYSSTDPSTLLGEFRAHWNTYQWSDPHDLAHLMTGKDLDGTVIGIAYLGTLCNGRSYAYALSQSRFSANFALRTGLTAHEIGHNWGACHCDEGGCTGGGVDSDCSIMCSILGGCSGNVSSFGNRAQQTLENLRDTGYCVGSVRDCNSNGIYDHLDIEMGNSLDCDNNYVPDECQFDCNSNGIPDNCDISGGTSLTCNFNNIPDECDIAAGTSQDTNTNGVPDECDNATIIFVDADAVGLNNGSSWSNAFSSLQDALAASTNVPTTHAEIWVAAGEYKPAAPGGSRTAVFDLVNTVSMYGGFDGSETIRAQSDSSKNITVLSGDLNGDDGLNWAGYSENSYHVVNVANSVGGSTVFSGFTVTHGNGDKGAGMLVNGWPMIKDCVISYNRARLEGGGAHCWNTRAVSFVRCSFIGNTVYDGYGGGGLFSWNDFDAPVVVNCQFLGNSVTSSGGGLSANHKQQFMG